MKKVSKIVLALLLAAVVCVGFVGCGGSSSSDDKVDYVISTDTNFPPFEVADEKDPDAMPKGFDMDILAAIAKDQGFTYSVVAKPFDTAYSEMESGQTDGIIAGVTIKDSRKEKADFSDPYFESGLGCAVKADNDTIKSLADLKGKKVACKNGTDSNEFAEKHKDEYGYTVVSYPESTNMYQAVESGQADACFEDFPVIGNAIITFDLDLKTIGEKMDPCEYGFAVPKGKNAELIEKFNAGLKNIKDSGEYQKIYDKYFG